MKPTTITLPGERAAQLRALADADGTTISEVIERLINSEIAAGRLPDTLPGFEVHVADRHVWLVIGDFGFPAMHPTHANTVAALLTHLADSGTDGRGNKLEFGEIVFKAARKGRGVLIGGEDHETGRTIKSSLTLGMARDLARIIRKAALKAARSK